MKPMNYNKLFKKYSANSQRNTFTGNHSKIINKFNLKKFGGPNDFDFDGIINKKDCNPFSSIRQDFTPFRDSQKATQMTAAKRFGGQNLKGLKRIGQGRDRAVYALDKDKVLKVAKNPGGLTQNTGETDIEFLGMGKHYESGKDYVVMKKNNPLSSKNKRKLAKVRKEVSDLPYGIRGRDVHSMRESERFSGYNNVLDEVGIGTDILNYEPVPAELFANRQWGEDEEGNLALNDGGALQDNDSLKRHRVKDFSSKDWQTEEWRDTINQRKQYKNKGSYTDNLLSDSDNDGVPNYYDCNVSDPQQQGPWHGKQSLWHAGNKSPSQTLKDEGRVFGFSSKEYADAWKEKYNKKKVYQFITDEYDLDTQNYSPRKKGIMNDNEYIAKNILIETEIDGASIEKQNEWKDMFEEQRNIERQNNPDTDGDRVPDEYDCQPDNIMRQDGFLGFGKKKEKTMEFYPDVTDEEFKQEQQYKQNLENNSYGEVKSYSGEKVGNAMIMADMVIPTGRTLSLAGLGVKKYVDKVKFVKTDEHDNKYKIPRMEVHKKSNNDKWIPEHRNEYYDDDDGYMEIQSDNKSMNNSFTKQKREEY